MRVVFDLCSTVPILFNAQVNIGDQHNVNAIHDLHRQTRSCKLRQPNLDIIIIQSSKYKGTGPFPD
jgi:hypothetical protein